MPRYGGRSGVCHRSGDLRLSRVVNPENPGFHEAGEGHWSDATLEGRAREWKGAELEFPLKLGLHCKRKLGALVTPITLVGLR